MNEEIYSLSLEAWKLEIIRAALIDLRHKDDPAQIVYHQIIEDIDEQIAIQQEAERRMDKEEEAKWYMGENKE